MFGITLTHTRAQDFKIGAHTVRVCVSLNGKGGMYEPHVSLHLKGPNGSPNGVGPKGWPKSLWRLYPYYNRTPDHWSSTLEIPLPHVSWARGYKLRRFGGLFAYKQISRVYRRALPYR